MLPIDSIVQVNMNVSQAAASGGVFDVGLIMTPCTSFTEAKRLKTYSSSNEALGDLIEMGFTSTSQICRYVLRYFGVEHTPRELIVSCYPKDTQDVADETPAEAYNKVLGKTPNFYGVCVAGVSDDDPLLALEETIRACGKPAMLFIPIPNPADYAVDEARIMYKMYERETDRCSCLYCNQPADAAAFMGETMGLVSARNDSSFTMCYRSLKHAQAQALTVAEIDSILAIEGNCYVSFGTRDGYMQVLEKGTVASGKKIEDVLYIDMIASELQNTLLNVITGALVKLPQIDSTTALFISECNRVLEGYYNRGILATKPWRGSRIKNVANGDVIEHGYICMADSFNDQSAEDRAAHKAMPITVLLCPSGSVESVVIALYIQQ